MTDRVLHIQLRGVERPITLRAADVANSAGCFVVIDASGAKVGEFQYSNVLGWYWGEAERVNAGKFTDMITPRGWEAWVKP